METRSATLPIPLVSLNQLSFYRILVFPVDKSKTRLTWSWVSDRGILLRGGPYLEPSVSLLGDHRLIYPSDRRRSNASRLSSSIDESGSIDDIASSRRRCRMARVGCTDPGFELIGERC